MNFAKFGPGSGAAGSRAAGSRAAADCARPPRVSSHSLANVRWPAWPPSSGRCRGPRGRQRPRRSPRGHGAQGEGSAAAVGGGRKRHVRLVAQRLLDSSHRRGVAMCASTVFQPFRGRSMPCARGGPSATTPTARARAAVAHARRAAGGPSDGPCLDRTLAMRSRPEDIWSQMLARGVRSSQPQAREDCIS